MEKIFIHIWKTVEVNKLHVYHKSFAQTTFLIERGFLITLPICVVSQIHQRFGWLQYTGGAFA